MKRWVGAGALITAAMFVFFARMGEAPAAEPATTDVTLPADGIRLPTSSTAPRTDPVVVEHEMIEVAPALRRTRPAVRSIAASAPAPRATERRLDFVQRAGRAILGDGRYRPQPFPSPGSR